MEERRNEFDRRTTPEQVRDRERLREDPPPILVTNVSMLEYMLVRRKDAPILERSKGKLRWIVLDEHIPMWRGGAPRSRSCCAASSSPSTSIRPACVSVATSATIAALTRTAS